MSLCAPAVVSRDTAAGTISTRTSPTAARHLSPGASRSRKPSAISSVSNWASDRIFDTRGVRGRVSDGDLRPPGVALPGRDELGGGVVGRIRPSCIATSGVVRHRPSGLGATPLADDPVAPDHQERLGVPAGQILAQWIRPAGIHPLACGGRRLPGKGHRHCGARGRRRQDGAACPMGVQVPPNRRCTLRSPGPCSSGSWQTARPAARRGPRRASSRPRG